MLYRHRWNSFVASALDGDYSTPHTCYLTPREGAPLHLVTGGWEGSGRLCRKEIPFFRKGFETRTLHLEVSRCTEYVILAQTNVGMFIYKCVCFVVE
jgi:hypothetical protein